MQISKEERKPIDRIKHLLIINQKANINQRFWQLLDEHWQGHGFEYVGCCARCGSFELR
jgi:hypothetical protein